MYQASIDGVIDRRRNDAYAEATEMTAKIGHLMQAQGKAGEFSGWITELKARHRQKRNFIKELAAAGL